MMDFLLPIWLSGIMLSIVSGPIGSFIIWQRMSYFGDTLSHASLLGISFGLFFNINLFYAVIIITLILSMLLIWLEKCSYLTIDSLLGIIAHSTFSLGLILISFMSNLKSNLTNYLFGDLLSVNFSDVLTIFFLDLFVLIIFFLNWNKILLMIINIEIAKVCGINVQRIKMLLIILTSLVISISMKIVGTLLITSMLIIPSATARRYASSPEGMVIISIIIGCLSVTGGLIMSIFFDTPVGPSIVLVSTVLFLISILKKI